MFLFSCLKSSGVNLFSAEILATGSGRRASAAACFSTLLGLRSRQSADSQPNSRWTECKGGTELQYPQPTTMSPWPMNYPSRFRQLHPVSFDSFPTKTEARPVSGVERKQCFEGPCMQHQCFHRKVCLGHKQLTL